MHVWPDRRASAGRRRSDARERRQVRLALVALYAAGVLSGVLITLQLLRTAPALVAGLFE